jgi:hypothetical protein
VTGLAALLGYPLYLSVRLVGGLDDDTRIRAAAHLTAPRHQIRFERYTPDVRDVASAAELDLEQLVRDRVRYVVTSSFMYERYEFGARIGSLDAGQRALHARYQQLFRYPYEEIRPHFRTFAFSNPVIRIVDLQGPERPIQ